MELGVCDSSGGASAEASIVTGSTTLDVRHVVPESVHREDLAHFVRWALAALETPTSCAEHDLIVELPEAERGAFGGQQRLRLPLVGAPSPAQESLAADSRFGLWLAERLHRHGPALHARPQGQPMTVSEIAARLFPAYSVDRGQMHLAGCQLTDHPFVRLSYLDDAIRHDGRPREVRHVFVAPDGSAASDDLAPRRGPAALAPIVKPPPPRLDDAELRSLVAAGQRIAVKQSTHRDPDATVVDPVAVTVCWVRHVAVRLQFVVGAATASHELNSWAALLEPKPWVARHSGVATFHLAATDDGRLDAADQIAVCQQSGRRVLRDELVECSVTGKQVLPDFTERCPASGLAALRHEFADCTQCRQRVSRAAMAEGLCSACRELAKVRKDDSRIVWIVGGFPGLDRWNQWQLAETGTVYIAVATGLLKRLLVVIDKQSLTPLRVATASRLAPAWLDASDAERAELLG